MGLMASGFGISMAVHPPLGQWLIDTFGWRHAWVILGVLTWLSMLPAIVLLAWDRPEDRGLNPDGETTQISGQTSVNLVGLTLAEALRTSTFYICVTAYFSISMLVTTLHFFQVSVLETHGVASNIAAFAFPVSAAVMLVAMPIVGKLFDHFKTRYVFTLALIVQASSLILITFATDLVTTLIYAVCFGLNNAFSMTIFGYLWPRYFGRKHVGEIQGAGQMVSVVGASLGPLPMGLAFDYLSSPDTVIRVLAIFPLCCALAVQWLRTPTKVQGFEHLD